MFPALSLPPPWYTAGPLVELAVVGMLGSVPLAGIITGMMLHDTIAERETGAAVAKQEAL